MTTMWARIENGTVAEITDIDPAGRFHSSLIWVTCGSEVKPGWLYSGKSFSAPPPVVPATRDDVEADRLRAYADPLTGSDRYFAEAARLHVMGASQEEISSIKALGAARYEEIQNEHPWP